MLSKSANIPLFLLAFANANNDRAQYLRNLPDELREIKSALDQAKSQGLCDYVELSNATLSEILDTFTKPEYRNRISVFHYAGHANDFQLLLETNDGRVATADAAGLAAFLSTQLGLQLVFLNGCSTERQVDALVEANIPMVISTSQAIKDDVAKEFARRFYRGLASGINVRASYKEAEGAVRAQGDGNPRHLFWVGAQPALDKIQEERWPWNLHVKKGAEVAAEWSLPEAAGNPLFGIPQVPHGDLPAVPFRSLNWFTRQDAEVFFGRNYEIRQLYDRITEPFAAPIVLLYGGAGVGKSSLLDAGITPRLESSHRIIYLRRNQQLGLLGTAAQVFNFAKEHSSDLGAAWQALEEQSDKPLLFIMDQLEELFTRPNGDPAIELKEFLDALVETFAIPAKRPQGKLILGFRKEWESEIEQRLKEARLPHAQVFLDPLDRRDIIQAVAGPTSTPRLQQQYGIVISEGLAEIIADDLSSDPSSPIAPTLQILLSKMWAEAKKRSNAKPTFDLDLYRELKRQGILLNDFIDQQLTQLQEFQPEAVRSGLILDLLTYHTTSLGTAEQRSQEAVEQEYKHRLSVLSQLLEKLKEVYLLADPPQDMTESISTKATRLAHDTLAPLIRARFNNSVNPGQRARRILENRSVEWTDNKTGTPLDNWDLKTVETGLSGMRATRPEEDRLINASREARSRRESRKRIQLVVAAAAIVLIVANSVYAWWLSRRAEAARQQALSRQLAAQADSLKTGAARLLPLRALLAIEALQRFDSAEGNAALQESLRLLPVRGVTISNGTQNVDANGSEGGTSSDQKDDRIRVVQFSPDGKILGIAAGNVVRLWDLTTNTEFGRFQQEPQVKLIRFSPDGRYLVAANGPVRKLGQERKESPFTQGLVTVWDCAEHRVFAQRGFPTEINEIGFVKDEPYIVIVDMNDATTTSLDIKNDHLSWPIIPSANQRYIRTALTNDGKYLAVGNVLSVSVYEVGSGHLLSSFEAAEAKNEKPGKVEAPNKADAADETDAANKTDAARNNPKAFLSELSFSPDGSLLVTNVFGSLQVWNWKASRPVSNIEIEPGRASWRNLEVSPDNKYIASFSEETELVVWDATNGKEIVDRIEKSEETFGTFYPRFSFSPDSRFVAVSSGDRTARIFGLQKRTQGDFEAREFLRIAAGQNISAIRYSPDGQSLVTGDEKGDTTVWSLSVPFESGKISEIEAMQYDPENRYVLVKTENYLADVRLSDNQEIARFAGGTSSVVFSNSGERFAFVDHDEKIQVCDTASGRVLQSLQTSAEIPLAFSQDETQLLLATRGEHVKQLNIQSGEVKLFDSPVVKDDVAVSSNGKFLATIAAQDNQKEADQQRPLEIFDLEQGQKVGAIVSSAFIPRIVFSANNNYLATNIDSSTVVIWDLKNRRELRRFTIEDALNELTFSKNSNYIASTAGANAFVWNVSTGALTTLKHESGFFKTISFSNDSKSVVTTHSEVFLSSARLVEIWQLSSGERQSRISMEQAVSGAIFGPNDDRVILFEESADDPIAKQARFLPWKSDDLITEACKRVGRNFTTVEWTQYMGNEPYRQTCENLPPEP